LHAFEVFQFPAGVDGGLTGDIRISEMRRRLVSDPDTCDIPDGVLWALDIHPEGDIVGSAKFNSNDLDEATLSEMLTDYVALLRKALDAVDAPINTLLT